MGKDKYIEMKRKKKIGRDCERKRQRETRKGKERKLEVTLEHTVFFNAENTVLVNF